MVWAADLEIGFIGFIWTFPLDISIWLSQRFLKNQKTIWCDKMVSGEAQQVWRTKPQLSTNYCYSNSLFWPTFNGMTRTVRPLGQHYDHETFVTRLIRNNTYAFWIVRVSTSFSHARPHCHSLRLCTLHWMCGCWPFNLVTPRRTGCSFISRCLAMCF